MTTPATPLDRAKRAQELSAKATEGPWFVDERTEVWTAREDAVAECWAARDVDDAAFIAETRTLAPALAEDVTQLIALWELCKPLCQHVPGVAEKARALGLLAEKVNHHDEV